MRILLIMKKEKQKQQVQILVVVGEESYIPPLGGEDWSKWMYAELLAQMLQRVLMIGLLSLKAKTQHCIIKQEDHFGVICGLSKHFN